MNFYLLSPLIASPKFVSWALKNWCFRTVVLVKTLESPLDCKRIKPVHPKGNQSWIFTGRTDAEASVLWPPDVKSWLTGKDSDAGKDRRQKGKETTEDEMVGWHHWFNGHEFVQTAGDGGQGGRVCCSAWGRKESDSTEWLNKAYQNPVTTKWNPTSSLKVAKSLLFQRDHSLNSYTLPHIHTCITTPSTEIKRWNYICHFFCILSSVQNKKNTYSIFSTTT